jgi:hypothetical protein
MSGDIECDKSWRGLQDTAFRADGFSGETLLNENPSKNIKAADFHPSVHLNLLARYPFPLLSV